MDCSTPGFLDLHLQLEFVWTCPLSWWCHLTISSSVVPFSSCPQSFPALGFFLLSWLFASSDPSIGASASASALPMNIQGWFPLGLTGLISLPSKDSQKFSLAPQFESISFLVFSFLYGPTLTSVPDYWKSNSLDYMDLYWQNGVSALSYAEAL